MRMINRQIESAKLIRREASPSCNDRKHSSEYAYGHSDLPSYLRVNFMGVSAMGEPELATDRASALLTEFQNMDERILFIIKGHLLIEEHISRIIKKFVPCPEHIDDANLRFHQKVHLARCFCLQSHSAGMWNVILSINSLRNEIAHNLNIEKRDKRLMRLKAIYEQELKDCELFEQDNVLDDTKFLMLVFAFCTGFLNSLERDSEFANAMNTVWKKTFAAGIP